MHAPGGRYPIHHRLGVGLWLPRGRREPDQRYGLLRGGSRFAGDRRSRTCFLRLPSAAHRRSVARSARAWHCGVPYAGHHGQLLVRLHFGVHVFGAAGIAARTGHELYARRSAHAARRHRQRGVHVDGRSPVRPSWCEGARVGRCGDGSHRWCVVLCHRC